MVLAVSLFFGATLQFFDRRFQLLDAGSQHWKLLWYGAAKFGNGFSDFSTNLQVNFVSLLFALNIVATQFIFSLGRSK